MSTRKKTRASPMRTSGCAPPAPTPTQQRRHLAEEQQEIGRLTAFWHYFKRRRRLKSLELLRNHVVMADAAVGDLHSERSAIENEASPEFPGLSLAARRNINLAIISYAELLCENADAYRARGARQGSRGTASS